MKKILSVLIAASFLAVVALPMAASAVGTGAPAPITSCTISDTRVAGATGMFTDAECPATCTFDTYKTCGMCCTLQAVYKVSDWLFIVLVILVSILIIWGAFQIVTAAGAPEKVTTGRNFILYALIGLVVAFFSKALPALVKGLMGF